MDLSINIHPSIRQGTATGDRPKVTVCGQRRAFHTFRFHCEFHTLCENEARFWFHSEITNSAAAMLDTVGAQHSREYFDIYVHFLSEERLYFGPISYRSLCAFFAKEKPASMAVARPRPLSLRPLTGQRARMC